MLTPPFDRVESWHSARFAKPWLGPLLMTRGLVLAALVMALIAVFANVKVRYDQGQIWKANPDVTEIAGAMSFSTILLAQTGKVALACLLIFFSLAPISLPKSLAPLLG